MSAFIVSDNHIDALVTVALFGVAESTAASGRWFSPYVFNHPVCVNSAGRLGEMLLRENVESVHARYPKDKGAEVAAYTYKYPIHRLPVAPLGVVAALKLVKCYEYQSCEHDGWAASDAKKFCSALTSSLINALPGYDTAPWAI